MADKKITQLTNITGANLVDADEFVVVDISADETKAITLGELKEAFDSGSGFVRITGDTMTGPLDVQSTITADGLDVSSWSSFGAGGTQGKLRVGSSAGVTFIQSGLTDTAGSDAELRFTDYFGVQKKMSIGSGGDISFYNSAGTSAQMVWDASAESLGIGVADPDQKLEVNGVIKTSLGSGGLSMSGYASPDMGYFGYNYFNNNGTETVGQSARSSHRIGMGNGATNAITFDYRAPSAAANTWSEAMRIDSSGTLITKGAAVFNEDGADKDFRVESDANTHALFVDASASSVAIGHASPSAIFDVKSSNAVVSTLRGTTSSIAYLDITNYATSAVGVGAGVEFRANTSTQERQVGFITASYTDATDATRDSRMDFNININGGTTRALELGADEITINEGGQNTDFRVESDTNANMLFVDAGLNNVGIGKAPGSGQGALQIAPQVAATNYYRPAGNYAVFGDSGGNGEHDWVYLSGSYTDTDKSVGYVMQDYNGNFGQYAGSYIRTNQAKVRIGHFVGGANSGTAPSLADNFIFDTAGGAVFNERGSTGDFRVESDGSTHMLFVDAGDNTVLVNNSVSKGNGTNLSSFATTSTVSNGSTEAPFFVGYSSTGIGDGFIMTSTDQTSFLTAASFNDYVTDFETRLVIRVHPTSTPGDYVESMRFGNSEVVVNEQSRNCDFRVESDSNANMLIVDAGNNRVGIGTTPACPLNVVTGTQSAVSIFTNTRNVSGDQSLTLGLGSNAQNTSSYYLICQEPAVANKLFIYGNGNVVNTNNSYGAMSDARLKENIVDSTSQWDDIKAIQVRKYSWVADSSDTPTHMGVIAQELEASGMGGLVDNGTEPDPVTGDPRDIKTVKYSVLYMKAVKALQEAMDRIETLEAKVSALENA